MCMTVPLSAKSVASESAVTVTGTKGGLPRVEPAQILAARHSLKDSLLQAPSSGHRLLFPVSLGELDSINSQMSLEVAPQTATFRGSL